MDIDWFAEEAMNTLAHATTLKINGIEITTPTHAITKRDLDIAEALGCRKEIDKTNLVVAGESLNYLTFSGLENNRLSRDGLLKRLSNKTIKGKINLVFTRIPHQHKVGEITVPVEKVSEIQTINLLSTQRDAGCDLIIPPLPTGLKSINVFRQVYKRTKIDNQTSNNKEIVGYIPRTAEFRILPEMIDTYIKDGIRFFAVDFSSSPLDRALIRTTVYLIRSRLKIKSKVGEDIDKQYFLHIFDVPPNKKTSNKITPITKLLIPAYGIDSTSGVIWGGGKLIYEKLRYFNIEDYGAYQLGTIKNSGLNLDSSLTNGSAVQVYNQLRVDRLINERTETKTITRNMESNNDSGLAPYYKTKNRVEKEVGDVLSDVKEIMAR
jgi:hypothetical protein